RRSFRASANVLSGLRTPATTFPVAGSMTSPTAFTATIAPTTRPLGSAMEAVPIPDFVERPAPPNFPTVAPAPAPTVPSCTTPVVAASAALYPQSAVGRIFGLPPTPRSNRIAAGTIGTRDDPAGQPMLCSSSQRTVPVAAAAMHASARAMRFMALQYCIVDAALVDRVSAEVDRALDEIVQLTADLVRIPTVNPPGDLYDACAHFLGDDMKRRGFEVEYIAADGRPEHTARHPRVNVVCSRRGGSGPVVHLNGHIDVVPPGDGWTVDPFAGVMRDGKIFGRGVCDMKAGIAAAVFAAEAIARAGIELPGTIEISGTVDEESGGFAGVAHLAGVGRIKKGRTDFVIIPEPLN